LLGETSLLLTALKERFRVDSSHIEPLDLNTPLSFLRTQFLYNIPHNYMRPSLIAWIDRGVSQNMTDELVRHSATPSKSLAEVLFKELSPLFEQMYSEVGGLLRQSARVHRAAKGNKYTGTENPG
jgi:hypothetical protein